MHPTILLSNYLVFAAALSLGNPYVLIPGFFLFIGACIFLRQVPNKTSLKMVWRLRWLFFSLFIIYILTIPGSPLHASVPFVSVEGLVVASQRAAVLLLLVLAVQVLLQNTSQERLLQGLYWLFRPVRLIGLNHERMILRIALTLQIALEMGEKRMVKQNSKGETRFRERIRIISNSLARYFKETVEGSSQVQQIEITLIAPPKFISWLIPVFLLIAMMSVELAI